MVHVTVYYVVGAMMPDDPAEGRNICPRSPWVRTVKKLRAQAPDLLIEGTGRSRMSQEVELEAIAVYVTEHMHEPRLDSAPIHAADDMQDSPLVLDEDLTS
jgi:hypothetical protein